MFVLVDIMQRAIHLAKIDSDLAKVLLGTIVIMGLYIVASYAPFEIPFGQWKFGILSVALGWIVGVGKSRSRIQFVWNLVVGVILAMLVAVLMDETRTHIISQLLGLAMVLAAVLIRTQENRISRLGKDYALYVYLSHIFVGMIVFKFLGTRGDLSALLIFVGSLLSGIIITFGLSKMKMQNAIVVRNCLGL